MTYKLSYVRGPNGRAFSTMSPERYAELDDHVVLSRREGELAIRDQVRDTLRTILAPIGKQRRTVHTILRRVAASGMSRDISFVTVDPQGTIVDITDMVATATGRRIVETLGKFVIREGGCGMDMGFHVVYGLGRALWPEGTPDVHGTRNGEPDREGGYAIKQAWL